MFFDTSPGSTFVLHYLLLGNESNFHPLTLSFSFCCFLSVFGKVWSLTEVEHPFLQDAAFFQPSRSSLFVWSFFSSSDLILFRDRRLFNECDTLVYPHTPPPPSCSLSYSVFSTAHVLALLARNFDVSIFFFCCLCFARLVFCFSAGFIFRKLDSVQNFVLSVARLVQATRGLSKWYFVGPLLFQKRPFGDSPFCRVFLLVCFFLSSLKPFCFCRS